MMNIKLISCIVGLLVLNVARAYPDVTFQEVIAEAQAYVKEPPPPGMSPSVMRSSVYAEDGLSRRVLFDYWKKGLKGEVEAAWWRSKNSKMRIVALALTFSERIDPVIHEGVLARYREYCLRFKDEERNLRIKELEWAYSNRPGYAEKINSLLGLDK